MPLVFSFAGPERPPFECELQCQRCAALTAGGAQCRNRACIGVPKCWVHLLRDDALRIKTSSLPGAGRGLFAVKRNAPADAVLFRAGDKVADYGGEAVDRATLDARYGQRATAPYGLHVRAGAYEDAACRRGVGAVANHAGTVAGVRRYPNAALKVRAGRGVVVATRPIRNNAEVLVSYGRSYRLHEPGVVSGTRRLPRRRRRR